MHGHNKTISNILSEMDATKILTIPEYPTQTRALMRTLIMKVKPQIHIMNDLLDLAQLESSSFKLRSEFYNLFNDQWKCG